jgi:hypothetical protein
VLVTPYGHIMDRKCCRSMDAGPAVERVLSSC